MRHSVLVRLSFPAARFRDCFSVLCSSLLFVSMIAGGPHGATACGQEPTTAANAENSAPGSDERYPLRWFKGNLHTHSLWSDGDEFPEMIASWYAERGYNFLALSDHNTLSRGMRWMPLSKIVARSDSEVLERYRSKFGDAWVETRRGDDGTEDVRLKPLEEFRCLVESSGRFIMIEGEEISGRAGAAPIHMNLTNVVEAILPANAETPRETMQNIVRQAKEQEEKTGREMLLHLNHPNFHYAVTAEDIAHVVGERFFEVYNGHPGVNHQGDDTHPGIEKMWDIANAIRLGVLEAAPLMGIATDDSHEYHGQPGSRPGRGWIMVHSRYLTPEHLIKALKRGDFYASSGVELSSVEIADGKISVSIQAVEGESFQTQFIATKRATTAGEMPTEVGVVVSTQEGLSASYSIQDDELYVRACTTSSAAPSDPAFKGQRKQAWTQLLLPAK